MSFLRSAVQYAHIKAADRVALAQGQNPDITDDQLKSLVTAMHGRPCVVQTDSAPGSMAKTLKAAIQYPSVPPSVAGVQAPWSGPGTHGRMDVNQNGTLLSSLRWFPTRKEPVFEATNKKAGASMDTLTATVVLHGTLRTSLYYAKAGSLARVKAAGTWDIQTALPWLDGNHKLAGDHVVHQSWIVVADKLWPICIVAHKNIDLQPVQCTQKQINDAKAHWQRCLAFY